MGKSQFSIFYFYTAANNAAAHVVRGSRGTTLPLKGIYILSMLVRSRLPLVLMNMSKITDGMPFGGLDELRIWID